MKKLFFIITLFSAVIFSANAQTDIEFQFRTDRTGWRGGNQIYFTVNYSDGTSAPEASLNKGVGFGAWVNSVITRRIDRRITNRNQIRSITIRVDGNARSGHPFDTYANWEITSMRISARIGGSYYIIGVLPGWTRFDGSNTRIELPRHDNSVVVATMKTGRDDLRGEYSAAKYELAMRDGTTLAGGAVSERTTSAYGHQVGTTNDNTFNGHPGGSTHQHAVPLYRTINIGDVQSVNLLHTSVKNGGGILSNFDQWELTEFRVELINPITGAGVILVESSGRPILFNENKASEVFPVVAPAGSTPSTPSTPRYIPNLLNSPIFREAIVDNLLRGSASRTHPDLRVAISLQSSTATSRTFSVKVSNISHVAAGGFDVMLNNTITPDSSPLYSAGVVSLGPFMEAEFTATISVSGEVFVIADPNGAVAESNETNNVTSIR